VVKPISVDHGHRGLTILRDDLFRPVLHFRHKLREVVRALEKGTISRTEKDMESPMI
jgi:hypothetical protein